MSDTRRQCTARSKQTGTRCKLPPAIGRTVCRFHGGATPAGVASPHWQTGRYSRHAPSRLAARIDAAIADPALMSLKDEAALVSAQIGEVLEVLDVGGLAARWRELGSELGSLRAFLDRQMAACERREYGDLSEPWSEYVGVTLKGVMTAIDAMDSCVAAAADERGRWVELLGLIDQKRKLVETQAKVDQRDTLSVTEQAVLVGAFVAALRLVRDEADRRAALTHLNRALEVPASRSEAASAP